MNLSALRKRRRVVDALREDRPGDWRYDARLQAWISADRKEQCVCVHTGGLSEHGDALSGRGYQVYRQNTDQFLGTVYP